MLSFVKEISSPTKYQNFKDVLELIIEYHNGYGKDVNDGNWNDWLMIIPINTSVMVNGFFAGIQTKRNLESIRAYKLLLDNNLDILVRELRDIDYQNE